MTRAPCAEWRGGPTCAAGALTPQPEGPAPDGSVHQGLRTLRSPSGLFTIAARA